MAFVVQFMNQTQAIARLNRILPTQRRSIARAAEEFLKDPIFAESQEEVPVDKGALKRSGRVEPVKIKPPFVTLVIKYGGVTDLITGRFVNYAVIQHEDLTYQHPKGGKANYLEDPVRRHKRQLRRTIERAVQAAYNAIYTRRV